MQLARAFLRLIRFPNLVFIALTQLLFYYFIMVPEWDSRPGTMLYLNEHRLGWLVLASVLIAAAGYIINDYFDLNIDRINKPGRLVIDKRIRRRWAIFWHLALSLAGLIISFYLDGLIGMMNLLAVLLLWFYSTTFKKQTLIGNVVISLLTAWVVLVLYLAETIPLFWTRMPNPDQPNLVRAIFKYAAMYGGFAFIISLVREVVKDVEDMDGDARYGCRTMPIAWGVPVARVFALVWLVVLFGALAVLQAYALHLNWLFFVLYTTVAVMFPTAWVFRKVQRAQSTAEWASASTWVKGVMLAGILSMLFFKWYHS
jgi:4-hydroxybenzoate polyprenyltransferase